MALAALPRVERLHLADLMLPDGHPAGGGAAVVFGFVIDHPGGAIVVDTGVGWGNQFIDQVYSPKVQDLDAALSAAGVDPTSVAAVVNSHLHFDHCGQNPRYYGSGVPVFVQADEVRAAREPYYTDPEWAEVPDAQLRALSGDEVIAEGVTILSTPGHTAGHQSVLVEGGGARVIIGAQCVWDIAEFHREEAVPSNVESDDMRDAAVASIRRLKALNPDRAYFSHHRQVYRRLR